MQADTVSNVFLTHKHDFHAPGTSSSQLSIFFTGKKTTSHSNVLFAAGALAVC